VATCDKLKRYELIQARIESANKCRQLTSSSARLRVCWQEKTSHLWVFLFSDEEREDKAKEDGNLRNLFFVYGIKMWEY